MLIDELKSSSQTLELSIGSRYFTKEGDVVLILEKCEEKTPKDGYPCLQFVGQFVEPIERHALLRGKTYRFSCSGAWLLYPGGIHDLVIKIEEKTLKPTD